MGKTDSGLAYEHILKDLKPILLEEALGGFVDSFRRGGASILPSLDTLLEVTGQLMQPVAAFLSQIGTKRIYLSPHAFLHAFPLHAAFLPDTKRFFIEDFEVCYTPSLTLSYRLFCSEACAGKKAMALFYAPADRPLPHGEQEFQYLIDTYGAEQVVPLRGEQGHVRGPGRCFKSDAGRAFPRGTYMSWKKDCGRYFAPPRRWRRVSCGYDKRS